ncbi:SDR family oxidoreductase [bacterium]|nr:SDR family oxidoreductase [bacterium]
MSAFDDSSLRGKVALITGASRGIGAATARDLAGRGVKVVLAARNRERCAQLAEAITADGGQAIGVACDVAKFTSMDEAVQQAISHFGQLDILVNNAGLIDPIARITDMDVDAWGTVIDVNVKGVFHGLRAALPHMLERGSGTVVNLSSGAATSALEGWSHYCSSKAAALSLTRCAHTEVGHLGITVVGLSPGTVETDMQDEIRESRMNPVSKLDPSVHIPPDWPAKAIAYLCTPAGREYAGGDFSIKTDQGRARVGLQ